MCSAFVILHQVLTIYLYRESQDKQGMGRLGLTKLGSWVGRGLERGQALSQGCNNNWVELGDDFGFSLSAKLIKMSIKMGKATD